jgi:hypothetical protein
MGKGEYLIVLFEGSEEDLYLLLLKTFSETEDYDLQIDWLDDEVNRSQAYALCCHIDIKIKSAYLEYHRHSSCASSTASP